MPATDFPDVRFRVTLQMEGPETDCAWCGFPHYAGDVAYAPADDPDHGPAFCSRACAHEHYKKESTR